MWRLDRVCYILEIKIQIYVTNFNEERYMKNEIIGDKFMHM